jgi:hypothetical protein
MAGGAKSCRVIEVLAVVSLLRVYCAKFDSAIENVHQNTVEPFDWKDCPFPLQEAMKYIAM